MKLCVYSYIIIKTKVIKTQNLSLPNYFTTLYCFCTVFLCIISLFWKSGWHNGKYMVYFFPPPPFMNITWIA